MYSNNVKIMMELFPDRRRMEDRQAAINQQNLFSHLDRAEREKDTCAVLLPFRKTKNKKLDVSHKRS